MRTIDKLNKMYVYSSFGLSSDDINCLSILYAPLIGSGALNLYLGLNSLLERNNLKSEELIHQNIFDIFGYNEETFSNEILKLEAIGLINTYLNNKNEYIYLLKVPHTAKTFLSDGTLGLYLQSKIGDEMFSYLTNHFKIETINKKEYKNITVNFDDVFKTEIDEHKIVAEKDLIVGRVPNSSIKVSNHVFDYNEFIKDINLDLLEDGQTEKFKNTIINTSYVYKFDIGQMQRIYQDSINSKGIFDYEILKKKANILFKYINQKTSPKIATKVEDRKLNYEVLRLDSIDAIALLTENNCETSYENLKIVDEIYKIDLPRGVLNAMIEHLIKTKDGKLPAYPYFVKTASSWMELNIFTTKDAYEFINNKEGYIGSKNKEKALNNESMPKKRGPKSKKDSTEWVDNYVTNVKDGFDQL